MNLLIFCLAQNTLFSYLTGTGYKNYVVVIFQQIDSFNEIASKISMTIDK